MEVYANWSVWRKTMVACGKTNPPQSPDPGEDTPPPTPPTPPPTPPITTGIDVWTETSYINVFRDFEKEDNDTTTADFIMAKNEYEAVQIVLSSSRDFTIENVEFSDLKSGSNVISKDNLRYNYVEYERMLFNSPGVDKSIIRKAPTYFPDALSNEKSVEVAAYDAQPIWVTLYVPATAIAGDYKGVATVETSRGKIEVEINVEVNDVTIPDAGSADSNYNLIFWQLMIGSGFSKTYADSHPNESMVKLFGHERWTEGWWEIVEEIADVMKENRINTLYLQTVQLLLDGGSVQNEDGTWTFNWSKFDEYVNYFLDRGIVNHMMGYMMMTAGNAEMIVREKDGRSCTNKIPFNSDMGEAWFDAYLPALYEHLVDKGWDKMWTQCVRDEPPTDATSRADYNRLVSIFRQHMPGIAFGDPTQTPANSQMLRDLEAPTLIPLLDMHHQNLAAYQNIKENQRVFTYSCVIPQGTYLNRFIDQPVYYGRSIGWYNYNTGADGFLHWGLMAWYRPITDFALGDTSSIYPDVKNRSVKQSIRLANLRDGAEEYELLAMLEKTDPDAAKTLADLVAKDCMNNFNKDPEQLAQIRAMLIRAVAGKPGLVGRPESVELQKTLELNVADGFALEPTFSPAETLSKEVVWYTSNPNVVAISQSGEVYALAPGKATITVACKAYPDVKSSCEVTVELGDTSRRIAIVSWRDASVRTGEFCHYRYGSDATADVAKGGANDTMESYFSFDATGVASTGIDKAIIRFWVGRTGATVTRKLALQVVSEEWDEATLTYATAPKTAGDIIAEASFMKGSARWLEFDVTEFVKSNPGNFTVKLVDITETANAANLVCVFTRENSVNRPVLLVTGEGMNYSPVGITSIEVEKTKTLTLGECFLLSPIGVPSEAISQTFRFESSNEQIAVVDKTGWISARGVGKATITIVSNQNPSIVAKCEVTVKNDDRQLVFFSAADATIESHRPTMNFGSGETFLTNYIDPRRRAVVRFDVSGVDEPIASIRLRLFATQSGKADKNEISVYLNNASFEEMQVTYENAPKVGDMVGKFTVDNATPAAYGSYYQWIEVELDRDSISADGTVTITLVATKGDRVNFLSRQTIFCPSLIIDYGTPVESIKLSDYTFEKPGTTHQLQCEVAPTEGHARIVFESSDPTTVSVDGNGLLTAIKEGEVTITAKSGNVVETCTITVNKPETPIEGLALNVATLSMQIGEEAALAATIIPANAEYGTEVVWESSDPNVVAVGNDGKIYAHNVGTATITVSSKIYSDIKAACVVTVEAVENASVFTPTQDSCVEMHIDTIRGTNEQLYIYVHSAAKRYALIEFELSNLKQAPASAKLKMYIANGLNCTATIGVYISDGKAWDEATLTRGNAPKAAGSPIGTLTTSQTTGWVEFDLDASHFVKEGKITLVLVGSGNESTGKYFSSRDGKYWPTLILDYGTPVTQIDAGEDVEIARVGLTHQLNVVAQPQEGHEVLFYISGDEKIVSVDKNGLITANGKGTATITVQNAAGTVKDVVKVSVGSTVNVSSIIVDESIALEIDKPYAIQVTFNEDANFGTELTYASADDNIAYIDKDGKIVGVKPGTTNITIASKQFPDVTATTSVTVSVPQSKLLLEPTQDTCVETHVTDGRTHGATETLYAYVNTKVMRYSLLEFDLSALEKMPMKVGLRMYITTGLNCDAVIGIYLSDGKEWDGATTTRDNAPKAYGPPIGTLEITKESGWVTFDLDSAHFTNEGKITLVLKGISATGDAGKYFSSKEGKFAPSLIIDYGAPITQIEVAESDVRIERAGLKHQLDVSFQPEEHEAVVYTSSNEDVAIVDNNGLITAKGKGEAKITIANQSGTISKQVSVTVGETVAVSEIKVVGSVNLKVGEEHLVQVAFNNGANFGTEVSFASSDRAIAYVTAAGLIAGVKPGTATITVTSKEVSSVTASIVVTVTDEGVNYIAPTIDATIVGTAGGSNYGVNKDLHTINSSQMRTVIVFDLSAYMDANVSKLTLRMCFSMVASGEQTLGVYYAPRVDFSEAGITWNFLGGNVGELITTKTVTDKKSGEFIEIEFDASVMEHLVDGKLALVLKIDGGERLSFHSKESFDLRGKDGFPGPMMIIETKNEEADE